MKQRSSCRLQLQASSDGHFLQHADGAPFFYLADTAWMLVNKLTEAEARQLFADRAAKGFTVIQAVVFRDLFEVNCPNVHGVRPFASEADLYAAKLNPEWLELIVRITQVAAEYGLVMAWLPTWGDKWNEHSNSAGPVIMDECSAEVYGRDLSDALGGCDNVIWVVGGDSSIRTQAHADIIHAMARGLRTGASRDRLITFHPCGGESSAIFHGATWLDINTMQSGHDQLNTPNYRWIEDFYGTRPVKPCLDIESNYERMPVGCGCQSAIAPEHRAFFDDYDVRRSFYRSVLAGAAGFAYGCDPIRQIYRPGDRCHAWDGKGIATWNEALASPGSSQLQLLKRLLLERSYFTRIPARELLREPAAGTGDPVSHVAIARCSAGNYIMVYVPIRQMLTIDTSVLPAKRLRISIYDPESGVCRQTLENDNERVFRYIPSRRLDTLLVIDAVAS
jgi:hypothetical protein